MNFEKKSIKIGDQQIAVTSLVSEGISSQKDIVFVHMSWGSAWAFTYYMPFFAKVGYRCHAVDLRGHGLSGGTVEGATMQNYVDDVHAGIAGLDLENPIVIGHSMGGLVALMYAAQHSVAGVASLDGSPPSEVQKTSEEKTYPASYTPADSGMPANPIQVMKALPDIYPWRLMKLKKNLTVESGIARSDRKRGISIPKDSITAPMYFAGAEKGTSLPFGIGIEKARAQAEYYEAPLFEIKGASHPGVLIGKHWKSAATDLLAWLKKNNL